MRGRRSAVGAAELGDGECGTSARGRYHAIVGCSQHFRGQVELVAFAIQNGGYVFEHSTRSCWSTSPLSALNLRPSTTSHISASRGRITPMTAS